MARQSSEIMLEKYYSFYLEIPTLKLTIYYNGNFYPMTSNKESIHVQKRAVS
jgi:hypothetical protein